MSVGLTFREFMIGGGGSFPSGATVHAWGAQLEAGTIATDYQRIDGSYP